MPRLNRRARRYTRKDLRWTATQGLPAQSATSSSPTKTLARKTTRLASDMPSLRWKTTALSNGWYVKSRCRYGRFTNDGQILRKAFGGGTTTALISDVMGWSANDDHVLRRKVVW